MLKVHLIKNVFEDEKVHVDIEWEEGLTYEKVYDRFPIPETPFDPEKVVIVSFLHGPISNYKGTVTDNDEITISYRIQGTGLELFVAFLIFAAKVAVTVAVTYGVNAAIQAIAGKPKQPSYGTKAFGIDDGSPTYGWDGVRSTQDVGIPVPVIYGRHRVGGNVINAFISQDGDKSYLNVLLALCEGEVESISDFQVKNQPIANYDGVTSETKEGTNNQSVIANFEDLHNVNSVDVALTKNNAHTYTTVDSDVEGFEVYLNFPGGLYQQSSKGGVEAWSVTVKFEYKINTDVSWTDLGSVTYTAKSRTAIRRIYRKVGLTPEKYDIRVTRTSDDSSLDPLKQGDLTWTDTDEIKTDDFRYPNTALVGYKALATEQLNGTMPNFTCLVEGKKISAPDVRDGLSNPVDWEDYYWNDGASEYRLLSDDSSLTWDGSTYVSQFCANPVWCLQDLLTNTRYGVGDYVGNSDMDLPTLVSMSQYCEEKVPDGEGGFEKRYRLDVVLDSLTSVTDVLTELSIVFNGIIFFNNGKIKFEIDRPDLPSQAFGMGNIIKDSFKISMKDVNEIYNVVDVTYINQNQNYEREVVPVLDEDSIDAGDRINKLQVRVHTTKTSYAIRIGRTILKLYRLVNKSVLFKASMDAISCQVGQLIKVSHQVPQWGFSGRVQSGSTTTVINLDKTITLAPAKSYQIAIRFDDDTLETQNIITGPSDTNIVEVGSAFSSAPAAYDNYVIGEVNVVGKSFRVMSIDFSGEYEAEIRAAEYDAQVYDDSAIILPQTNYSLLDLSAPTVDNLTLTEGLVKLKDGTIENTIEVWFTKPKTEGGVFVRTYRKAMIYISEDGGTTYRIAGETYGEQYTIVGGLVDGAQYTIKVAAVADDGSVAGLGISPSSSITILGKSAPPEDVVAFIVNQNRDRLFMGWVGVSDVDLSGYEIRKGASWEEGEFITFEKSTRFITTDIRVGANQKFWIKAIDTSLNYSENAKQATLDVDEVPFRNIIQEYSEQTAWSGTKVDTVKVGDNLELDTGDLTGTYVTPVRDIGYVATGLVLINAIATSSTGQRFDDDLVTTFQSDPLSRFSGGELPGALSFEIKTSEDNVVWSDWMAYQVGDYKLRYFQLRMTMTRENTGVTLQCTQLDYLFDLPDVDEFTEVVVPTASSPVTINFEKTYHEEPHLDSTIISGTAVFEKFTNIGLTSADIELFTISGTSVPGRAKIQIHGV